VGLKSAGDMAHGVISSPSGKTKDASGSVGSFWPGSHAGAEEAAAMASRIKLETIFMVELARGGRLLHEKTMAAINNPRELL